MQCVYRRKAGFDPQEQLAFLSRNEVTNVFTTPTAMRAVAREADRWVHPAVRDRLVTVPALAEVDLHDGGRAEPFDDVEQHADLDTPPLGDRQRAGG